MKPLFEHLFFRITKNSLRKKFLFRNSINSIIYRISINSVTANLNILSERNDFSLFITYLFNLSYKRALHILYIGYRKALIININY